MNLIRTCSRSLRILVIVLPFVLCSSDAAIIVWIPTSLRRDTTRRIDLAWILSMNRLWLTYLLGINWLLFIRILWLLYISITIIISGGRSLVLIICLIILLLRRVCFIIGSDLVLDLLLIGGFVWEVLFIDNIRNIRKGLKTLLAWDRVSFAVKLYSCGICVIVDYEIIYL